MAKQLKLWNGRGHIYVAAYTQKQAAELVSRASYGDEHPNLISTNEIKDYYSFGSWGNSMNGIIPTEPCVYVEPKRFGGNVIKVI